VDVLAVRRILRSIQAQWSAPGAPPAARRCAGLLARALGSGEAIEEPWAGEGLRCGPPDGLSAALAESAEASEDAGFAETLLALGSGLAGLAWKTPRQLVAGTGQSLSELLGGEGRFASAMVCRGTWVHVIIEQFRQWALQTFKKHRAPSNIFSNNRSSACGSTGRWWSRPSC
jgi:hypothetical protein